MDEYITKSDAVFAACRVLAKFGACSMGPFCPDSGCREVRDIINNVPAADVVAVVRCRECVYNRGETKDLWGNPAIKCVTAVTHEPDWYCASGKRKDGGQDE